ncbi:MAG: hypothetical protein JKY87_07115 [Mariprofundus sp.]|nr:hypothetical protein [Mariprofundus sp.]
MAKKNLADAEAQLVFAELQLKTSAGMLDSEVIPEVFGTVLSNQHLGTSKNIVYGTHRDDSISSDSLGESVILRGLDGNDTIVSNNPRGSIIDGGSGNDRLLGIEGADTYLFNHGDGVDIIRDFDSGASPSLESISRINSADKVVFGEGILINDLSIVRIDNHMIVRINNPTDSSAIDKIIIENWFSSNEYKIESFEFADGTSLSGSELNVIGNIIEGTQGNDLLRALSGGGVVRGLEGDDSFSSYIYARGTDAYTLVGGVGNDRFNSGKSADTYVFNRGDGSDTIVDNGHGSAGLDKITFGAEILPADIALHRSGNNLVVKVVDPSNLITTDQILIQKWFSNDYYKIESFEFADGTSLSGVEITVVGNVIKGTPKDDLLRALPGGGLIRGLEGNDSLKGYAGANKAETYIFEGGTGNDHIYGSKSSDTYIFSRGDGLDTITDSGDAAGFDKVKFGAGITASDLAITRRGNHLVAKIIDAANSSASDQITIKNWFSTNGYYQIESFEFTDGTSLSSSDLTFMGNLIERK